MSCIRVDFRDKYFFITGTGSATPTYVIQSYLQLEKEMREAWWDIKPNDVVMDVGAAYGSYTLPALAMGASKVIFFEPSKTEFFDICSNVMINGWLDRCVPHNALVGDTCGLREDYYQDSHSYRPEGQKDSRYVWTLDRIAEIYHLDKIDWLKIDTEGAEPEVLQGATWLLMKCKPKILLEHHVGFRPGVDKMVFDILTPFGYEVVKEHKGVGINDFWQLLESK